MLPIVFPLRAALPSMGRVMLCRFAENVIDRITGKETQFGCEVGILMGASVKLVQHANSFVSLDFKRVTLFQVL